MTIAATAKPRPLPELNATTPVVDVTTGCWTPHGIQAFQALRNYVIGMARSIPCSATGTNVITLTPNDSSPLLEKYVDHEMFPFVAANNSTAAVTALVVARTGNLATLKVYKTRGSAQAGNGDITAGLIYLAVYNDALDGGLGGLVLI